MDASTKRWMLVPTALTLALALIALGFAAMSTNPAFAIPNWLPFAFFIAAGVIVISLFVYLIFSLSGDVRIRMRRRAIADKLGEFYLSGEDVKNKLKSNDFSGDAISLTGEWAESLKRYFQSNPRDLGNIRLLLLIPRQADWFIFNQFNPLGSDRPIDDIYAFRHISIEMEKLLDLIGEFLR